MQLKIDETLNSAVQFIKLSNSSSDCLRLINRPLLNCATMDFEVLYRSIQPGPTLHFRALPIFAVWYVSGTEYVASAAHWRTAPLPIWSATAKAKSLKLVQLRGLNINTAVDSSNYCSRTFVDETDEWVDIPPVRISEFLVQRQAGITHCCR
jgi:hypothetical protein